MKPNKSKIIIAWIILISLISIILIITYLKFFTNNNEEKINEIPINNSSSVAINKALEEIVNVIGDVPEGRKDLIIDTYNSYIAKVDNELAKAMLNIERLYVEMNYDVNGERGAEIKAEALGIDEILRDVNSAGLVLNVASKYGDEELYKKYEKILDERGGVEIEMESEG